MFSLQLRPRVASGAPPQREAIEKLSIAPPPLPPRIGPATVGMSICKTKQKAMRTIMVHASCLKVIGRSLSLSEQAFLGDA